MVAPTSTTSPSSTAGSSVSCCALLKRWISSRKKIVRSPLVSRRCCGALDHLAHLGAAGVDRGRLLEGGARVHRQQARQRRLAGARRPVQDHRVRAALLDRRAQRRAAPEQVVLADELAQRRRAACARPAAGRPRRLTAAGRSSGRRAAPCGFWQDVPSHAVVLIKAERRSTLGDRLADVDGVRGLLGHGRVGLRRDRARGRARRARRLVTTAGASTASRHVHDGRLPGLLEHDLEAMFSIGA